MLLCSFTNTCITTLHGQRCSCGTRVQARLDNSVVLIMKAANNNSLECVKNACLNSKLACCVESQTTDSIRCPHYE